MDATERLAIESRINNDAKNIVVAYLLWIFLGFLGIHRLYLGKTGTGIAQLVPTATFFGMIVTAIWLIIDLFLIPGIVNAHKEELRQKLTMEAMSHATQTKSEETQ